MANSYKEVTAFTARHGTYQFGVIPLGPVDAPSTFPRMVHVFMQGLLFVRVYIDDFFIFSKSMEEHVSHIQEVFQRLNNRSLKIELSKCHFAQSTMPLLCHVITSDGIRFDDCKIAAIKNSPIPTTPSELSSSLVLAGYYRRFIKGFEEISSVLHVFSSVKTH